jgi:hypothetical protein
MALLTLEIASVPAAEEVCSASGDILGAGQWLLSSDTAQNVCQCARLTTPHIPRPHERAGAPPAMKAANGCLLTRRRAGVYSAGVTIASSRGKSTRRSAHSDPGVVVEAWRHAPRGSRPQVRRRVRESAGSRRGTNAVSCKRLVAPAGSPPFPSGGASSAPCGVPCSQSGEPRRTWALRGCQAGWYHGYCIDMPAPSVCSVAGIVFPSSERFPWCHGHRAHVSDTLRYHARRGDSA